MIQWQGFPLVNSMNMILNQMVVQQNVQQDEKLLPKNSNV